MKAPGDTRYYLECTQTDRTGEIPPPGPYTVGGPPITDGTVVWTVGLEPSLWRPSISYVVGAKVRGSKADDNRFYFECAKSENGKSGAADPFRSPPGGYTPGDVVADGQVEWTVRVHAGIQLLARAYLRNLYIGHFTTAGVQIHTVVSGARPSIANGWRIDRVVTNTCGVGVWVAGDDANAGLGIDIDVQSAGAQQPGTGGFGIYDHAYLGATWIACQIGGSTSPHLVDGQASFGALIGCYAEGGLPLSKVNSPISIFSGQIGGDFTPVRKIADADVRVNCN